MRSLIRSSAHCRDAFVLRVRAVEGLAAFEAPQGQKCRRAGLPSRLNVWDELYKSLVSIVRRETCVSLFPTVMEGMQLASSRGYGYVVDGKRGSQGVS